MQGLFRNPLADPYLLGTAAGAGLAVVLVLAATTLVSLDGSAALAWVAQTGIVFAAFGGARQAKESLRRFGLGAHHGIERRERFVEQEQTRVGN